MEEKELRHVIGIAVSDTQETEMPNDRFLRVIRIRTVLGEELTLNLYSENRLALNTEQDKRKVLPLTDPSLRKWPPAEQL